MTKVSVVIPHSHTWFLTQTCVYNLLKYTPLNRHFELSIVLVNNSWDWSPSYYGITETYLNDHVQILRNPCDYRFRTHGSAVDLAFKNIDTELVLTVETDAFPIKTGWLHFFLAHLKESDYACGSWHHEGFINPSFTLYRRKAWEDMKVFCDTYPAPLINAYWGKDFTIVGTLSDLEVANIGPMGERRGWSPGTKMSNYPSGLHRGPGHYEPGQQFYHWAIENGYTAGIVPHHDTHLWGIPTGTYYGYTEGKDVPKSFAVHLWGGTRALDSLKNNTVARIFNDPSKRNVHDEVNLKHMNYWLGREAKNWLHYIPEPLRNETLKLIRTHGWAFGEMDEDENRELNKVLAIYTESGLHL